MIFSKLRLNLKIKGFVTTVTSPFGVVEKTVSFVPILSARGATWATNRSSNNFSDRDIIHDRNQLCLFSNNMAEGVIDCNFPSGGLMSKKITGVESFLNKYPEYDGRDVTIAIFDSGVDPAAAGLQFTSTGEKKVIERFDCSGCGDVDTTTTCQLKDGHLVGITGRKLKVPSNWENPSGDWRVGVVQSYNLYPTKLKERVEEHRKEFMWDPKQKTALASAARELADFEAKHASSTLSGDDKLLKEELEARVEALTAIEKKFKDFGPSYDCVLFHDGTIWRACIDTSEEGDLSSGVLLGEYSKTHEHKHLTELDQMTISINVHNNGNVLEIVGMSSSHGTHVASIASACFPDDPQKNGVAPGAKIVSLTIGDGRLGTMETGTALIRACIKVMELASTTRIDVINMSYGEHAHWSNAGRVGDIMNEVVNKYGVVWIVSAGNHGPALTTVGAPPDIMQTNLIGVGAYVSPEMMTAAYSMRSKLPGTVFTWSSRGPCADGAAGVSICAPGGAITSVPNFTLRCSQLMNGTSMSAPHAAGSVGVLLSGLKKTNLPYSPYSVKRALENSATYLPDVEPFAQGCGLLDVEEAFKMLSTHSNAQERDVRFEILCGLNSCKGVYLRGGFQDKPKEMHVTVEPFFATDFANPKGISDNPKKINFNMKLTLVCNVPWVKYPAFLDLMNISRAFSIRIEPECLPPGAHFTSIKAYDVNCISKGPVFQIPITVIQPERLSVDISGGPTLSVESCMFKPGMIKRHFVVVPEDATWAVLKFSSNDANKNGRFLLHCMQTRHRLSCKTSEFQKMVNISTETDTSLPFQVKGGIVLEIALSKFWANLGEMMLNYSIEFHGIHPECSPIVAHGADGLHCITLRSLRKEECQPQATLKTTVQIIRPSESKVMPLSERDVIPPGRQIYEIINTYNFHIAKATEITPNISLLSDMLYESEFESQLWMLFDSNKQHIASGDAYPCKYTFKAEKGDYVLKLNVRHDRKDVLDKLNELPMLLQQKLSQPLTLDVYASQSQALVGGKKMVSGCIIPGSMLPIYLAPLPSDKIGKNVTVGQYMTGSITFAKDEFGKKVDVYSLKYILPESPKKATNGSPGKELEKSKSEKYAKALRELKTSWLSKLEGDQAQTVYEELLVAFPTHLGCHTAYMQCLDPSTDMRKLPHPYCTPDTTEVACTKIIAIADKIIAAIDQDSLLAYLGLKNDSRPDAAKIKIQQDKQRGYLLEALNKRGIALCRIYFLNGNSVESKPTTLEQIKQTVVDILKFTDLTDSKVIHFALWHSIVLEQWGRSIKFLNKIADERSTNDIEDKLIKVYTALEWHHAALFATSSLPVKYPTAYRLF